MEWLEKYSDFDEFQNSRLALFCRENRALQLASRALYWLHWGLLIAAVIIGLALKEWFAVVVVSLFFWQKLNARNLTKKTYRPARGFLLTLTAYLMFILHFMQR